MRNEKNAERYVVAVTGASGAIYGWRLIQELSARKIETYVLVSKWGRRVLSSELGISIIGDSAHAKDEFARFFCEESSQYIFSDDYLDMGSRLASGSFRANGMVIAPCSMGTIASISNGISDNLIERRADIVLKERGRLVVVPRETPLNQIHLRNMLALAQMGADIVPAMPGFYHKPSSINDLVDFIVGRVLELLGIPHNLYSPWEGGASLE